MYTNGLVYAPNTPDIAQIRNIEYSYQVSLIADNPEYLRQFMVSTQAMQTQSLLTANAQLADMNRGILGIHLGIGELTGAVQEGISQIVAEMQRQNVVMIDIAKLLSTKLEGEAREIRNSALAAVREGCSPEAFDSEGSLREAMQLFRVTVEHPMGMRDYVAWFNIGWLHWKLDGNLEEADKAFATAVRQSMEVKDTYHVMAARHLAYMRYLQKKTDGAYQGIRLALLTDAKNPENLFTQILIAAQARNVEELQNTFRALITDHPDWLAACLAEPELNVFHEQLQPIIDLLVGDARALVTNPFAETMRVTTLDTRLAKTIKKKTLLLDKQETIRMEAVKFLATIDIKNASWPTLYNYVHHWLPRCKNVTSLIDTLIEALRSQPKSQNDTFLVIVLAAIENNTTKMVATFRELITEHPEWTERCMAEPEFYPFQEQLQPVIDELVADARAAVTIPFAETMRVTTLDARLAKTIKKKTLLLDKQETIRMEVVIFLATVDIKNASWPTLYSYVHIWLPRCKNVTSLIDTLIEALRYQHRSQNNTFLVIVLAAIENNTTKMVATFRELIIDHPEWLEQCMAEPELYPFHEQLHPVINKLVADARAVVTIPFAETIHLITLDARLAKTIKKKTLLTGIQETELIEVATFLASIDKKNAAWPTHFKYLHQWLPRCKNVTNVINTLIEALRNQPKLQNEYFICIVLAAIENSTSKMVATFRELITEHPEWTERCMTEPELYPFQKQLQPIIDKLVGDARVLVKKAVEQVNAKIGEAGEMARSVRRQTLLSTTTQNKISEFKTAIGSVNLDTADWPTMHRLKNSVPALSVATVHHIDAIRPKVQLLQSIQWVQIPAGAFLYGENKERKNLPAFDIMTFPVTVAQYRIFCADSRRSMPRNPGWDWQDSHPIVNVTWDDAAAFAEWAGLALPTEEEWEKAARGTDGRKFPWGNWWNASKCDENYGYSSKQTSSVGKLPAGVSPYGVQDMAGNVWEWCDSVNSTRVRRGGSWSDSSSLDLLFRTTCRIATPKPDSFNDSGFRCVFRSPGQ